jgi:hypothetical protein
VVYEKPDSGLFISPIYSGDDTSLVMGVKMSPIVISSPGQFDLAVWTKDALLGTMVCQLVTSQVLLSGKSGRRALLVTSWVFACMLLEMNSPMVTVGSSTRIKLALLQTRSYKEVYREVAYRRTYLRRAFDEQTLPHVSHATVSGMIFHKVCD